MDELGPSMAHHSTGHFISDREGHSWGKLQISFAILLHVIRLPRPWRFINTCLLKQIHNNTGI